MTVSETMKFKIHCVEEYRSAHNMSAQDTVSLFNRYGVFDFLEESALRWQSLENTVLDIDEYIAARLRKRVLDRALTFVSAPRRRLPYR